MCQKKCEWAGEMSSYSLFDTAASITKATSKWCRSEISNLRHYFNYVQWIFDRATIPNFHGRDWNTLSYVWYSGLSVLSGTYPHIQMFMYVQYRAFLNVAWSALSKCIVPMTFHTGGTKWIVLNDVFNNAAQKSRTKPLFSFSHRFKGNAAKRITFHYLSITDFYQIISVELQLQEIN